MRHYRKPLGVVSIIGGLALVVAGFVAAPVGAAEASGTATYSCQALLGGTLPLGAPLVTDVTVTLTAPASVAPGASFSVTAQVTPGLPNGPVAVAASSGAKATMTLGVTGGTPAAPGATSPTLVTGPANGTLAIPTLTAGVTAGASGSVAIAAGKIDVLLSSGFLVACSHTGGSSSIVVAVTSATTDPGGPTTTADPGATTTTVAGPTTVPTTAAPTTAAPTTAAPTTAAPTTAAPVTTPAASTVVTRSATVNYSCQAYLSGAATGPPVVEDQTVSITGVDRVNPGQSFPVTLSVEPGVTNGPVPQGAGEIVPSIEVSVTGGSPSPLRMTGQANTGDVPANGLIPVAPMSSSVTATASPGGTVDLKPGVMTMAIERFDANVVCTPSSRPTVLSVSVVAEPVVLAGSTTSSGSTGPSGSSTLANTGTAAGGLSLLGLGLMLAGVAALRVGRARDER